MIGLKVLALGIAALIGTQGALLKRELKVGETNTYEIKCSRSTGSEDDDTAAHESTTTWKAVYTIDSVDPEKCATVTVSITDFDIKGDDAPPKDASPKSRTIQATLTEKNELKPKSDKPTTADWLITDAIELPNKETKIGDTWDVNIVDTSLLGKNLLLQAKLAGEQDYEGHAAWVVTVEKDKIAISQKAKMDFNDGTPPVEGTITGTASLKITAIIEKGTGRTLCITEKAHVIQRLQIEGNPDDQPPMVTDHTATMKLKKQL